MENIRKLETTVAAWYKNAPHLPNDVRKWLATNAWWLVIIGVVFGVLGVLTALSLTFFGAALLAGIGGVIGAALGGLALIAVTIALLLSVVQLVIAAAAIQPLKEMKKKGWTLLFIITLIDVLALAVSLLLTFDLFGVIWGLLWAAVGVYFLFEIRELFEGSTTKKKVEATQASKSTTK